MSTRRLSISLALIIALNLAGVGSPVASAAPAEFVADTTALLARDALVGKWKATVAEDTGKETTDTITFKGGKFTSDTQKTAGFEPATYQDEPGPRGIGAKFSVTLTNKAGDTAKWSGFSTGSDIDGTLVITKKDGTSTTYTFKATKG